ncbi:hypothetical protein GGTG_08986 [Gaeumannomyces tritici R3-111a-1]|uniref:Uncharacterized protein n=1 Tax=Gaeumannomyces tritici (strain R3-111a-1) TaxID=644352 RepID=J3P645_GAET3|nr:hypothetical protein GGTG_08986 [Gaeumannomyces tritici R3-111a-1]EJT72118.1 hypothetical protein GGTG_08986 [Gaeumannomyces tritici R3-111a-1]
MHSITGTQTRRHAHARTHDKSHELPNSLCTGLATGPSAYPKSKRPGAREPGGHTAALCLAALFLQDLEDAAGVGWIGHGPTVDAGPFERPLQKEVVGWPGQHVPRAGIHWTIGALSDDDAMHHFYFGWVAGELGVSSIARQHAAFQSRRPAFRQGRRARPWPAVWCVAIGALVAAPRLQGLLLAPSLCGLCLACSAGPPPTPRWTAFVFLDPASQPSPACQPRLEPFPKLPPVTEGAIPTAGPRVSEPGGAPPLWVGEAALQPQLGQSGWICTPEPSYVAGSSESFDETP